MGVLFRDYKNFLHFRLGINLESGMLLYDYLGKYWTNFAETFTEYVKRDYLLCDHCNFPYSLCVKMKKYKHTESALTL